MEVPVDPSDLPERQRVNSLLLQLCTWISVVSHKYSAASAASVACILAKLKHYSPQLLQGLFSTVRLRLADLSVANVAGVLWVLSRYARCVCVRAYMLVLLVGISIGIMTLWGRLLLLVHHHHHQ